MYTDKEIAKKLEKAINDYNTATTEAARTMALRKRLLYRRWQQQRAERAAATIAAAGTPAARKDVAVRMIEERHAAANVAGQQARREAVARAAGFSDPQQFQPTHLSFVAGAQPTASADGGGAPPTQKKGPFHRLFGFSSRRFLGRKSRRRQDGKGRRRRRTRRRRHPKRKKRRRRRTRRSRRRKRGRQTRKRH